GCNLLIVPGPGNRRVEVRARHLSAAGCDREQNDMPLLKSHGNPSSFGVTIAVTPPERLRSRNRLSGFQYFRRETVRRKSETTFPRVVQPTYLLNNERSGGHSKRHRDSD